MIRMTFSPSSDSLKSEDMSINVDFHKATTEELEWHKTAQKTM